MAAAAKPPLRVRRATERDFAAVIDINDDVFCGLDYMPSSYFSYFHTRSHVVYVVEQDGLLVSLIIYEFNEPEGDDTTVRTYGVRVRPSHQGQGLHPEKYPPIRDLFLSEYPRVQRDISIHLVNEFSLRIMNASTVLCRYYYYCYKFAMTRHKPSFSVPAVADVPVSRPPYAAVVDMLTTTSDLEAFVARFCPSCLVMCSNKRVVPVDKRHLRELSANSEVLLSTSDAGDLTSFSHATIIKAKYGALIDVYHYGSDLVTLVAHVTAHIAHYKTVWEGPVGLLLNVHNHTAFDLKELERILEPSLGKVETEATFRWQDIYIGMKAI